MKFRSSCLQSFEGFAGQFVAFGFFRADAENADARLLVAENFARVDAAHDGEMRQVERFAIDVGAGIEQDEIVGPARA